MTTTQRSPQVLRSSLFLGCRGGLWWAERGQRKKKETKRLKSGRVLFGRGRFAERERTNERTTVTTAGCSLHCDCDDCVAESGGNTTPTKRTNERTNERTTKAHTNKHATVASSYLSLLSWLSFFFCEGGAWNKPPRTFLCSFVRSVVRWFAHSFFRSFVRLCAVCAVLCTFCTRERTLSQRRTAQPRGTPWHNTQHNNTQRNNCELG